MAPEDSPCAWPVAKIRKMIAAEFPLFRRASIRVIRRGHNLVVAVAGDWIFKFPWHPKANHHREIGFLKLLRGRIGVAIPEPVFIARGGRFFGYRRIPGRSPRAAELSRLSPADRERLAASIAEAVEEVQGAVPEGSRRACLGPRPGIQSSALIAREASEFSRVFARNRSLVAKSRRVFAAFAERCACQSAADSDRVGFDLQLDNLLVDAGGRLTGLVDFGFLQW